MLRGTLLSPLRIALPDEDAGPGKGRLALREDYYPARPQAVIAGTQTHRLLLALLVSLLLHVALISGAWLSVPVQSPVPPPLEARLATAPPPAAIEQPAPPRKPRPVAPRRATPAVPPLPVVTAATPLALPPEPADTGPEPAEPFEPAPPSVEPTPEPAVEPAPPAPATAPPPVRSLPRKGRITYALYFGTDKFNVGKAIQSWEVDSDVYMLASEAETTGIVDFFRPQRLRYLSQGKLTAQGLRPEKFLTSRTRRGRTEAAQARFDWGAGSLTFGNARNPRSVALPAGSQDVMSFIYQMSLVPPQPGRFRVPVTNGSRFETYDVEVLNEETIDTPLGALQAVPVRQVRRAGIESIEIWLAVEFRYLPVKIRFLNREGNPAGEQIANEIRVSEE